MIYHYTKLYVSSTFFVFKRFYICNFRSRVKKCVRIFFLPVSFVPVGPLILVQHHVMTILYFLQVTKHAAMVLGVEVIIYYPNHQSKSWKNVLLRGRQCNFTSLVILYKLPYSRDNNCIVITHYRLSHEICEIVNGFFLLNSLKMSSDLLVTLIVKLEDREQIVIYDLKEKRTTLLGLMLVQQE